MTAAGRLDALRDRTRRQPGSTIVAAAGVGYVLGGGLRSQLTFVVFSAAARLGLAYLLRELGELAEQNRSRVVQPARLSPQPLN